MRFTANDNNVKDDYDSREQEKEFRTSHKTHVIGKKKISLNDGATDDNE